MAKEINLELPNVDDLFKFSTNKGKAETVVMIPIEEITDFPNHPFKVRDDERYRGKYLLDNTQNAKNWIVGKCKE